MSNMSKERRWMLENAMWRMFQHGQHNNPVSAQCELKVLDTFLAGGDVPAWHTPAVPQTKKRKP